MLAEQPVLADRARARVGGLAVLYPQPHLVRALPPDGGGHLVVTDLELLYTAARDVGHATLEETGAAEVLDGPSREHLVDVHICTPDYLGDS